MQIYQETSSMMNTNTYIAVEGGSAIVVDPGDNACAETIKLQLDAFGARVTAILITHAHFDHIAGVARLKELYEGAKVYAHRESVEYIHGKKNLGKYMGVKVEPFEPDVLLEGGERLNIARLDIDVIYTPGHSKDGVCYIMKDEGKIFTGDTIFFKTYGRTDLFDGDLATLKNSAKKLFSLEGDYRLLPGHGEETTLDFERKNNPILCEDEN